MESIMTSDTEFKGVKYGYVRVSTEDQTDQLQRDALIEFGVAPDFIFSDKMSGSTMNRPGLAHVIKLCRAGDMLVVWKLDRLGRTVRGVLEVVENLHEHGVELKSVTEPIDTTSAMGRMVMTILLALAQMERDLISERTRAGMQAFLDRGGRTGPKHGIRDYPLRPEAFKSLILEDRLKDMTGREVIEAMNTADPNAPRIKAPQMYFNWKREGFPGLELADPRLDGENE